MCSQHVNRRNGYLNTLGRVGNVVLPLDALEIRLFNIVPIFRRQMFFFGGSPVLLPLAMFLGGPSR